MYQNIKSIFELKNDIIFDYILIDSLEGDGIEDLLNLFPTTDFNQENNKNNCTLLGLYDKYSDKEREEFVITCKVNDEGLDLKNNSINVDETKLNCYYIDDKTLSIKNLTNLIPFKVSLADGVYIQKLDHLHNQFISLKFKLNSVDENFQNNSLRNSFISFKDKDENLCFFDTFEADIIITSLEDDEHLKEKAFTVLTKGCKCLFSSFNADVECTIVGISGEYDNANNNKLIQKKIINCKNGVHAKIVINLSHPILATKFNICAKFGSFILLKEGETFAVGKINKYKPKK